MKKIILTGVNNKTISDRDTKVVTTHTLRELCDKDAAAICIEFMNRLACLTVGGKSIKEWFKYRNTSLWWFVHPVLFPIIEDRIKFVEQFENVLEQILPDLVEIRGFYDKIDLIKQICNRKHVKLSVPIDTRLHIAYYLLKSRLRFWRINVITRKKENRRIRLAQQLGRNKLDGKEGCVIFVSPTNYRREIHDLQNGKIRRGEYLVQKILSKIKQKETLLCIDVDYSFRGDLRNLEDRLLDKDFQWIPIEIFLTDPKSNKSNYKVLTERLGGHLRTLFEESEFKQYLIYKDIKLWKTIKPYFQSLLADAYLPTYMKCIEAARYLLSTLKPKSIFLTYETGPYSKAFIVAGNELGIRSIGLQHGGIHKTSPDYAHRELAINSSNLGCPLPTDLVVYGDFTKKILTEKHTYPAERLHVVGHPEYDGINTNKLTSEREFFVRSIGLDPSLKIILVATAKYQKKYGFEDYDLLMVETLVKNLSTKNNLHIILKPHPQEDPTVYRQIINNLKASNVSILEHPIQHLILACDVFVTITSTAAIEALVLKKPVVILQISKEMDYLSYVESGAALGTKLEELPSTILKLVEDRRLTESFNGKRKQFIKNHFNIPSQDINEKIAQIILRC